MVNDFQQAVNGAVSCYNETVLIVDKKTIKSFMESVGYESLLRFPTVAEALGGLEKDLG